MKNRNFIKTIFFVSALINLSSSGKTAQFFDNDAKYFPQTKNVNWVNKVFPKHIDVFLNKSFQKYKDNYKSNSKDKILQIYRDESRSLLANSSDIRNELEIQSEIQSEENNILKAKGNVLVFYGSNILKADSLIYDKTQKTLSAQ